MILTLTILILELLLKDNSLPLVWKVLDSVMETFQFSSLLSPALSILETSLLCLMMCHLPLQVLVCQLKLNKMCSHPAIVFSDDLVSGDTVVFNLHLGNPLIDPLRPFAFSTLQDNMMEEEECLVFTLSINETALDPRDRGQVDLANDVALLRIQDPALMCTQALSLASILVDCDANFPFGAVSCSFDEGPPQPCMLFKHYSTLTIN